MTQARITVVMPVYNGQKYLRPAIESILNQTFGDFELLVIDDGSTDDSREICRSYGDARIRLQENKENLGLVRTLNKGLDLAGGEYIARMDCDDISFPERFARQVAFMEEHPEIGICGTWYEKISDRRPVLMRFPTEHETLRFFMLFDNPFLHSTMFIRRAVLESRRLRFDPDYSHAEDYEFWARCAEYTRVANIPEVLLRYRFHPDNVSHRFKAGQSASADRIRRRQLEHIGLSATEAEIELHNALAKFEFFARQDGLEAVKAWLDKFITLGCGVWNIPEREIYGYLSRYWYGACGKYAGKGFQTWQLFRSSPVGRAAEWEWQWKLLVRCLLRKKIDESLPDTFL